MSQIQNDNSDVEANASSPPSATKRKSHVRFPEQRRNKPSWLLRLLRKLKQSIYLWQVVFHLIQLTALTFTKQLMSKTCLILAVLTALDPQLTSQVAQSLTHQNSLLMHPGRSLLLTSSFPFSTIPAVAVTWSRPLMPVNHKSSAK